MSALDRVRTIVKGRKSAADLHAEEDVARGELGGAEAAYEGDPTPKRWEAIESLRKRLDQLVVRRRAAEHRESEEQARRASDQRDARTREIEELRARTAYVAVEALLRPIAADVAAAAGALARASASADAVEDAVRRDGGRELELMRARGDSPADLRAAEARIERAMSRVRGQMVGLSHDAVHNALVAELGPAGFADFDPAALLGPLRGRSS